MSCFRFLPGQAPRLIEIDSPDEPAPWLHPHPSKQALHSYYGPVRQHASPRYSTPSVSAFGEIPLATSGSCAPGRRIDARLLTFLARAADRAHAASTPD